MQTETGTAKEEVLPRMGNFYLLRRDNKPDGILYLHEYDEATGRSSGRSLRTRSLLEAEPLLYETWLKRGKPPEKLEDASVLDIMNRYFHEHRDKATSARSANYSRLYIAEFWPGLKVSELDADGQKKIIKSMRIPMRTKKNGDVVRRWSDLTILYYMTVVWAALNYATEHQWLGKQAVPQQIKRTRWDAQIIGRNRLLTDEEVAAMLNAAGDRWAKTGDSSWWFYLVQCLGFMCRPGVPLSVRPSMLNLRHGTVDLLPPGKKMSKTKRYAVIKMCPTLRHWLVNQWTADNRPYCVKPNGKNTRSMGFFWTMRAVAGLDEGVVPYNFRHYMSTCLIELGVNPYEKDIAMGHAPRGSRSGAGYVHENPAHPAYLGGVAAAIETVFQRLSSLVRYPLVPSTITDDQPDPQSLTLPVGGRIWTLAESVLTDCTPPPTSVQEPAFIYYNVGASLTAPQSLFIESPKCEEILILTDDACFSGRYTTPKISITCVETCDRTDT